MIFLVVEEHFDEPKPLDISFANVTKYPCFSSHDPTIWESTRNIGVPWMEVESKFMSIICQTKVGSQLKQDVLDRFDTIIEFVIEFTKKPDFTPFRIVFDLELPGNESICGYPIFLLEEDLVIFDVFTPSTQLFKLIYYFFALAFPEKCLPEEADNILCHVGTCLVFQKYFPKESPIDFSQFLVPHAFTELYSLVTKFGIKPYQDAIRKVWEAYFLKTNAPNQNWVQFLNLLTLSTRVDLSHLIPKSLKNFKTPSKMNFTETSSDTLRSFLLTKVDSLE